MFSLNSWKTGIFEFRLFSYFIRLWGFIRFMQQICDSLSAMLNFVSYPDANIKKFLVGV